VTCELVARQGLSAYGVMVLQAETQERDAKLCPSQSRTIDFP
jgi:hypothetical protein